MPRKAVTKAPAQVPATTPPDAIQILSVIERVAMDPSIDVEKMNRLLDMQERILNQNARRDFAKAKRRVQKKLPSIVNTFENETTSSHYQKLGMINMAITPIYTEEGFNMSFGQGTPTADDPLPAPEWIRVTCRLAHDSGHHEDYHYDLPPDNVGPKGTVNKTMVHARASSISYGRRYLTNMIWNLSTLDEDDDAQSATLQYITDDQIKIIENKLKATGANLQKFLAYMKVERVDGIHQDDFITANAALDAYAERKKGKEGQ